MIDGYVTRLRTDHSDGNLHTATLEIRPEDAPDKSLQRHKLVFKMDERSGESELHESEHQPPKDWVQRGSRHHAYEGLNLSADRVQEIQDVKQVARERLESEGYPVADTGNGDS